MVHMQMILYSVLQLQFKGHLKLHVGKIGGSVSFSPSALRIYGWAPAISVWGKHSSSCHSFKMIPALL